MAGAAEGQARGVIDDRRQQPDRRAPGRGGGRREYDEQPDWISVTRFAARYGVDRGTVYKWLGMQLLDIYRVGSLVRIRNLPPDQHRSGGRTQENC
jgi:hypothetical protein